MSHVNGHARVLQRSHAEIVASCIVDDLRDKPLTEPRRWWWTDAHDKGARLDADDIERVGTHQIERVQQQLLDWGWPVLVSYVDGWWTLARPGDDVTPAPIAEAPPPVDHAQRLADAGDDVIGALSRYVCALGREHAGRIPRDVLEAVMRLDAEIRAAREGVRS